MMPAVVAQQHALKRLWTRAKAADAKWIEQWFSCTHVRVAALLQLQLF
jgi:hypothetical protein